MERSWGSRVLAYFDAQWPHLYWNQRPATLVVKARLPGGLRNHGLLRTMEVPMTMHGDHHTTDVEDAAFDATMKIGGVVIGLLVIAGMALWYMYS